MSLAGASLLPSACGAFVNCRDDRGVIFGYAFRTSDVSTVDYFHLSLAGQNSLASVSWAAGYWGAPQ